MVTKDQTVQVTYKVLGKDLTKEEATAVYNGLRDALGMDKPEPDLSAMFPAGINPNTIYGIHGGCDPEPSSGLHKLHDISNLSGKY